MAKSAAAGVDVAVVEAHLARCDLLSALQGGGSARRGPAPCTIASANGTKDSIAAIVVVCTRCGYLMPLAADRVTPADEKAA